MKKVSISVVFVVIIFISFILNIRYAEGKKISEPIFFKHYYESYVAEGQEVYFEIYNITNADDTNDIYSIEFPNIEGKLYTTVDSNSYGRREGRYYSKNNNRMRLSLFFEDYEKIEKQGEIILEDATVYFQDGSTQNINIGKIILSKYNREKGIIKSKISSASSNGLATVFFDADEPVTLTGITSNFLEETKGLYKIEIKADDDTQFNPANIIEEADYLSGNTTEDAYTQWDIAHRNYPEGPYAGSYIENLEFPINVENKLFISTKTEELEENNYYYADISLQIHYVDQRDKEYILKLYNIQNKPYFTNKELEAFVESRGK